ncbi:MAG: hypothetical protein K8J08_07540, partial [Thermoanaerobaculia bacterium]|nr:hypothetical protein [Thermoanaerobaculia bacterium]
SLLRALERLLRDLGHPVLESRIEPAGPSHLIVTVVAVTNQSRIGELLRHLHRNLCRPASATGPIRREEDRVGLEQRGVRMAR